MDYPDSSMPGVRRSALDPGHGEHRRNRPTLPATMTRRRLHRLTATLVAVTTLLLSQLALAAYACPALADALAMAEMRASGQPCEGTDPEQPALCHEHMASPGKTFEAVKLPTATPPILFQVLVLPLGIESALASANSPAATPEARPPPDPLFLSTLRRRI